MYNPIVTNLGPRINLPNIPSYFFTLLKFSKHFNTYLLIIENIPDPKTMTGVPNIIKIKLEDLKYFKNPTDQNFY